MNEMILITRCVQVVIAVGSVLSLYVSLRLLVQALREVRWQDAD